MEIKSVHVWWWKRRESFPGDGNVLEQWLHGCTHLYTQDGWIHHMQSAFQYNRFKKVICQGSHGWFQYLLLHLPHLSHDSTELNID